MARKSRNPAISTPGSQTWKVALYMRLSRDDGDKPESDSIANQRSFLEAYLKQHPELQLVSHYTDDGFTGTNFHRPQFQAMLNDIQQGIINCVIVKDLSRFGRDYINVGNYLERWFPEQGVRFIAVNDNIDSMNGPYDMLLPVKNVFNEHYARDISRKVKSAMQTKQRQGAFIGAFASYGYRKDPADHNKLLIDPIAAEVVVRIFTMFEQGMGKIRIAKTLNAEGIPCPSEYKRLNGDRYHNGQKIQSTTYWTYATIHRILRNQMYIGNMEQGRAPRQTIHGKAKQLERSQWTVVPGTHEPIISTDQWERVQNLLQKDTRSLDFTSNISPLAGFLRCGDCGRAMTKVSNNAGKIYFCCGSYKRYGPTVCSKHRIAYRDLEKILLDDLNTIISAVGNLKALAEETQQRPKKRELQSERERLQGKLELLYRKKKIAYEDYRDQIIRREDYLRYKEDYEQQEQQLETQLERLNNTDEEDVLDRPWVEALLKHGKLTELDRTTVAETVQQILVYENDRIEITYNFSDDLGLLAPDSPPQNT